MSQELESLLLKAQRISYRTILGRDLTEEEQRILADRVNRAVMCTLEWSDAALLERTMRDTAEAIMHIIDALLPHLVPLNRMRIARSFCDMTLTGQLLQERFRAREQVNPMLDKLFSMAEEQEHDSGRNTFWEFPDSPTGGTSR